MIKQIIREVKGIKYVYLESPLRIGHVVKKVSRYVGPLKTLTQGHLKKAQELFEQEIIAKEALIRRSHIQRTIDRFEYPLSLDEVKKIEEMNIRYKYIMRHLPKRSIEDLNKRFIANYVFESNALEGNSLTLKNVVEVIFEQRISKGKDFREIYDAQNAYAVFLFLKKTRHPLDHMFIIKIHAMMMEKIDERIGYRKEPAFLLGRVTQLTKPEDIPQEMEHLLQWYREHEERMYPLELAFKFHALFEKIHPFCDGNGRVGRFLLNYILIRKGYFPIIIRKTTRNRYIKALEAADRNKWIVLMRFALENYKKTFRNFFEVYYTYAKKEVTE